MVGELCEPLGGSVVAEKAVVDGELGDLASEEAARAGILIGSVL